MSQSQVIEAMLPQPVRQWSHYQEAIFAAVEHSRENLVVEALAGTGKSTTIEEIVYRTNAADRVLVVAFNRAIKEAMAQRIADPSVEIRTLNGFGAMVLRENGLAPVLKQWQVSDLVRQRLTGRTSGRLMGDDARKARWVTRVIGLAKASLTAPLADDLEELAEAFALWPPKGSRASDLARVAADVLRQQERRGRRVIDFDDQVWLPIRWDLEVPHYAVVLVDEAQDLSPAQLELCLRAAAGGRLIAVGDRHQSIYQFRGADAAAIPRIISEARATVLPLSISYRCARAIVAEAQELVPAFEAAANAAEGRVREATSDELFESAQPGDFVLSRLNAPLIRLAYEWLRAGVACEIRGRNIAADLVSWIESLKADSLPMLRKKIELWLAEQLEDGNDRKADLAGARAECVLALADAPGIESVEQIVESIEEMFASSERDEAGLDRSVITLSSTHRAKGLEAERVWLLRDTFRPGDSDEERNLLYVAITRAKSELIYVSSEE